jgi:N-acetylmuramic acid 6-phosphate etherase
MPIKLKNPPPGSPLFLGIETGASRSVAILADAGGGCLQRIEGSVPANLRLLSDAGLRELLQEIARRLPPPTAVGIGMAGALDASDRGRILAAAAGVWPGIQCWAGNDLETALAAADDAPGAADVARVVVISGTGASCYGRGIRRGEALTGGWGHLLGDRGSGYDIALRALQAGFLRFDESGRWPPLGRRLLRALHLDSPAGLIAWAGGARKPELAALAVQIFAAAATRDPIARAVLDEAAGSIARAALACAGRIARRGQALEFVLTGSVLQKQPAFARRVADHLQAGRPGAAVKPLAREGAWGAVFLARQQRDQASSRAAMRPAAVAGGTVPALIPRSRGLSPTEQRHPRSRELDRMSLPAAIRLMLTEDATLPAALLREEKKIARAVELMVRAFRRGGRLFYVGAGTSGRLGALDAYECPPTFSVPPEMVQAIVAGGNQAMAGAREDAEDDPEGGAGAVRARGVTAGDVVIGIAASGRTPFVWGALAAARALGATTILVCFNPKLVFRRGTRPTLVIAPEIGPEILTGSTRLKAGTATKLLLNLFTTLSMVRLGKVVENLMVDVHPTNAKLRERAIRILRELSGAAPAVAERALQRNAWSVQQALADLKQAEEYR